MKKIAVAVAAIVVFLMPLLPGTGIASAGDREAPEQILKTLPSSIGAFIAEAPYVYEKPEWGVSIGYNDYSSRIALTLYLYDNGQGVIEDGIASKAVLEEKKSVIQEIKEVTTWRNVSIIKDGQQEFNLDNGKKVPVLFTQFSLEDASSPPGSHEILRSDLYLIGAKGYYCKIRITRLASTPADAEERIKEIEAALLSKLID